MQRPTLEEARRRLRELGYLDAGVDRMLFRPTFEGRGRLGVWLPAIGIGAFAAALASLAAIEVSEPAFTALDSAACVFLHLFLANLLPASLLSLGLSFLADHSRSPGAAATVAGAGAAALIFALWTLGTYGLSREIPISALLWGVPVGGAALFLAAAVRLAFLARAFARSGTLPGRAVRRVFAAAATLGLLAAVVLFSARQEPAPVPAPQPAPRPVPVVVIAVDGLDMDSGDRADKADKPAAIAALLSRGAVGWWPAQRLTPPELWTNLASGAPSGRHGVRALTRVRPLGATQPVRPPLGTSWYLRRVGPALRTVASAPVSGADRRGLDFWEVSASSGIPSLAVGWWASAAWPGATVVDNRAVLAASKSGVDVDRVAIQTFADLVPKGFGVQTLYLPGCDIERDDPAAWPLAVARLQELLEKQVARARADEIVLVVLAADSHPKGASALGRMAVFEAGVPARTVRIRPDDVAPSILARSGVPTARDLAGRPAEGLFRPGSLEKATVASYGPRIVPPPATAPESDKEYLEKLRSLGYLK